MVKDDSVFIKHSVAQDMESIKCNWHDLSDEHLEKLADGMSKLALWVENKVQQDKTEDKTV